METQRIVHLNYNHKRKLENRVSHISSDDSRSCKYLKIAAEKPTCERSVAYRCFPPMSYGLPSRVSMQQDAFNFQRSGVPSRFMYYDEGKWKDYPRDVIAAISVCFLDHKSSADFSVNGKMYVVNFVHMVQLNIHTGFVRSVAWIDDNGKCFTPSKCVEGHDDELLLFLQHSSDCKVRLSVGDLKCEASMGSAGCHDATGVSTTASLSEGRSHDFAHLGDKLIKLAEGDQDFTFVKDKFLSSLALLANHTTVTGIYRCSHTSTSGQVRLQAFRWQEEATGEARGDANVRYAWHGTSKEGAFGITLHGFGQPRVPKNGAVYGVGVYLAPEDYPLISVVYSNVDENGEQHMVLCRVVMGRMEQVCAGSQQFHPSSEDYDTGVDDIGSPKRYIIWSTHMNTHILPQYIISFKLAPSLRDVMLAALRGKRMSRDIVSMARRPPLDGQVEKEPCQLAMAESAAISSPSKQQTDTFSNGSLSEACDSRVARLRTPRLRETANSKLNGASRCRAPRSPWISFPELFSLMESKLNPSAIISLRQLYLEFQVGNIPRDLFVRKMRSVTGDDILRDCIESRSEQGMVSCSTKAVYVDRDCSSSCKL